MGATEHAVDGEGEERNEEEGEKGKERKEMVEGERDVVKGEVVGNNEKVVKSQNVGHVEEQTGYHVSMLQRLNPSNPLRIVINGNTRVATSSPSQTSVPRSTPTPQIAAYGEGFVQSSKDTWQLFERQKMVDVIDSDMTGSICFLTGVCSGSICVIVVAAWTAKVHQPYSAPLSLLAFFVGYLMTRIAMALPHACVSCYYVCYAENPDNRLFDKTIKDRQHLIDTGRDVVVPTPRVPRRFVT